MAGLTKAISDTFRYGANALRQGSLTPEQIKNREKGKRLFEMIKVASIVSVIGALFLVGIFPKIFTVVLAGVVTFEAHEIFRGAENLLEILNQATVELSARVSKETLFTQIGKDTIVLGPLLRAINPPCGEIVFS